MAAFISFQESHFICLVPGLLVPFSQHIWANEALRISSSPSAATVYSVRSVSSEHLCPLSLARPQLRKQKEHIYDCKSVPRKGNVKLLIKRANRSQRGMCLVPLKSLGAATSADWCAEILPVPGEWVHRSQKAFEYSHHSLKLHKLKHKIDLACEG